MSKPTKSVFNLDQTFDAARAHLPAEAELLAEGDLFHTEVVTKGKVLYEKGHARVGAKGRKGLPSRSKTRSRKRALS